MLIALDRMERGQGEKSAVQEVRDAYGIPVVAIATLDDLMRFIAGRPGLTAYEPAIAGVSGAVRRALTRPAAEAIGGNPARRFGSNDDREIVVSKGERQQTMMARRRQRRRRRAARAARAGGRSLIVAARAGGVRAPARAATYKWVDDKGVVHYTRQDAAGGRQQGQRRAQQARRTDQEDRAGAHARAAPRARAGTRSAQRAGRQAAGRDRAPRPRAPRLVHERGRDRPRAQARAADDRQCGPVGAGVQRAAQQAQGRRRGQEGAVQGQAGGRGARSRAREHRRRARAAGRAGRAEEARGRRPFPRNTTPTSSAGASSWRRSPPPA